MASCAFGRTIPGGRKTQLDSFELSWHSLSYCEVVVMDHYRKALQVASEIGLALRERSVGLDDLFPAKAVDGVIVDHTRRLHVGIANRRANELKAALL